jgi:sugar lactone lactonase YvrE
LSAPIQAELVLDARARLGEGPVWDAREGRLYWVDIDGCALHVLDPQTGEDRSVAVEGRIGFAAPRSGGGLIAGVERSLVELDPESGELNAVATPEEELPGSRFNDGKCDPRGRLWAGTIAPRGRPGSGSLYRLDRDRNCARVVTGVTVSNGLGWSPDSGTMYYIDSRTQRISAFDFDAGSGEVANRREIISFDDQPGTPDGMCVDAEGMLWIAHFRGGCASRWDPASGERLGLVAVPAPNTTSCAFGGAGLDELYVTSARAAVSDADLERFPHSGGVFRVRPGVRGLPTSRFGSGA